MESLVLVGYRVMPPWVVSQPRRHPNLPAKILTLSSCLVDAVPDDDAWFASPRSATRHLRPGVSVLAMGLADDDVWFGMPLREPWPAELPVLGYELVSPDGSGFHSWHCYRDAVAPAELNAHGLVTELADARRLAEQPNSCLPPIPWLPAAVALA